MTGLMVILVRVSPHQRLELVEQDQALAFLEAAGGSEDRCLADGAGVEVGVEDDLTGGGEVGEVWSRYAGSFLTGYSTTGGSFGSLLTGYSTIGGEEEIQGGLGAGEVAEGLRASYVQRLRRTEGFLLGRLLRQGPVEVHGVGDVELGLEPHGAGEVDVLVMQRRVPWVDVEVAVLRICCRVRRRPGRTA